MVSYKLYLDDVEYITISFEPDHTLHLTVDGEKRYDFSIEGGELKIRSGMKTIGFMDCDDQSDFVKVEEAEPGFEDIPSALNFLTRCCTYRGKEYCVENGCADTPCGRLCG